MKIKIRLNQYSLIICACLILIFQSCGSYKQNIMFKTDPEKSYDPPEANQLGNYVIQINDYLDLQVFTQNGEKIIDPDLELTSKSQSIKDDRTNQKYVVRTDGKVKFPMVGEVEVEGKTLTQAEADLKKLFADFYTEPFVKLTYLNKRVVVLGNNGGLVVPIENENTRVLEVLALSESINNDAKAHNIRLIRNNDAYVLDFSSIENYAASNIIVEPGDVLYVEPVRRPFNEFLRDNGPILGVLTSLISVIAVLISVR